VDSLWGGKYGFGFNSYLEDQYGQASLCISVLREDRLAGTVSFDPTGGYRKDRLQVNMFMVFDAGLDFTV